MRWRCAALVVGLGSLVACEEELPELAHHSEHARLGTDAVAQVCVGTLARIDQTIELIDEALGDPEALEYPGDDERAIIYVVDADKGPCLLEAPGCVRDGVVYLRAAAFDRALSHELVHARVRRAGAEGATPLFNEGIAVAIGHARRPPQSPHYQLPEVDALLATRSGAELNSLPYGYHHGGELSAYLLETHGAEAVLAFMRVAQGAQPVADIRELYTQHFARTIDDDLFVHLRDESELSGLNVNCIGPKLSPEPARARVRLAADLACDSARVVNLFTRSDRAYVEWIVEIDESSAGLWAPVRVVDDPRMPDDTFIDVRGCKRDHPLEHRWTPTRNDPVELTPGAYRLRWAGPIDGATIDLEIGGPCEAKGDDCEIDEICVGVCVPLASD